MTLSTQIVLNHYYILRHDIKRTYIISSNSPLAPENGEIVNSGWMSKIHPIYAMIFSYLSKPIAFGDAINRVAFFLDLENTQADTLLRIFLNHDESFSTEYKGHVSQFPKNIIIEATRAFAAESYYTPDQFIYPEVNLLQERLFKAPLEITFMVNNKCCTDCIYCYADKTPHNNALPFERVAEIITEARELGVLKFNLDGGEFFLYKYWEELLVLLIDNGFKPDLISTKIPIKEAVIKAFKEYNIPIQISLDSLSPEKLKEILNVRTDYCSEIMQTVFLLEEYDVPFQIATILTKYNDNIDNLEQIKSFLSPFKNLRRWEIRVAFRSLYSRGNFDVIKSSEDAIAAIEGWIGRQNKAHKILWSPAPNNKYFKSKSGSRSFQGNRCSANYSHMFILPDGQVSICEQLYWNSRFIIGNLADQSIEEVWSSPLAIRLAFPQKANFRDISACKTCSIFDDCYSYHNKCYADVLKGYGDDNWDYPDPRCYFAPELKQTL